MCTPKSKVYWLALKSNLLLSIAQCYERERRGQEEVHRVLCDGIPANRLRYFTNYAQQNRSRFSLNNT